MLIKSTHMHRISLEWHSDTRSVWNNKTRPYHVSHPKSQVGSFMNQLDRPNHALLDFKTGETYKQANGWEKLECHARVLCFMTNLKNIWKCKLAVETPMFIMPWTSSRESDRKSKQTFNSSFHEFVNLPCCHHVSYG